MKPHLAILGKAAKVSIILLAPLHKLAHSTKIVRLRDVTRRSSKHRPKTAPEAAQVEPRPDPGLSNVPTQESAGGEYLRQSGPFSMGDDSVKRLQDGEDSEIQQHFPSEELEAGHPEASSLGGNSDHDLQSPEDDVMEEQIQHDPLPAPESSESPRGAKTKVNPKHLLYNFDMYGDQLEYAQHLLWDREEHFDQEREKRDEQLRAGDRNVKTLAEIDADELQETRRLTRGLIQAEEQYNTAKKALLAAGIQPPGSDIESGFVDDVNDGYQLSYENEMILDVDSRRIQRWLGRIPDADDVVPSEADMPDSDRDLDAWSAADVEMCDSWSMVADGKERRRIDKWRALAASAVG